MEEPTTPPDEKHDKHPDPITGEPGAHPFGAGLGATGAGAIGAAIGSAGGPVGIVAGTAVGAVIGGLAGKSVAESMDPTDEEGYWQQHHARQVYAGHGSYDRYKQAYRTGFEGARLHDSGKAYFDVESDLQAAYEKAVEHGGLRWEHAKHAARAAFERVRASVKTDV